MTENMSRQEMLDEITKLEIRLLELKCNLPSPLKKIFKYRCLPEREVFVYASDNTQADERLRERMNKSYPKKPGSLEPGWSVASSVVDVISPRDASGVASGSIFRSLTRSEGIELLRDLQDDKEHRLPPVISKDLPMSQLERDMIDFERMLRAEELRLRAKSVPAN